MSFGHIIGDQIRSKIQKDMLEQKIKYMNPQQRKYIEKQINKEKQKEIVKEKYKESQKGLTVWNYLFHTGQYKELKAWWE